MTYLLPRSKFQRGTPLHLVLSSCSARKHSTEQLLSRANAKLFRQRAPLAAFLTEKTLSGLLDKLHAARLLDGNRLTSKGEAVLDRLGIFEYGDEK